MLQKTKQGEMKTEKATEKREVCVCCCDDQRREEQKEEEDERDYTKIEEERCIGYELLAKLREN